MTPWVHNYAPVMDSIVISAIFAALPVLFLLWALTIKRMKGYLAGLGTLAVAFLVATIVYGMPVTTAASATALGFANGLFPIGYIIVTSLFLYNIIVASGQFEVIKESIAYISSDRRMQALLIAFAFSAFLEGAAGQGAPVAIAAAILIGLGFPPMMAAVICLVANVPPVPFGPVGVPTITMANVTGIDEMTLTRAVAANCAFVAIIIPFATIWVMSGLKKTLSVLPAILVTGITYGLVSYVIAANLGPTLPSVITPLVTMGSIIVFLKVWQPKEVWNFTAGGNLMDGVIPTETKLTGTKYTGGQIFKAWSGFFLVTVMMTIWGQPAFKKWLASTGWFINIPSWPGLDGLVHRAAPFVGANPVYGASFKWDIFGYAGTAMLLATLITVIILKISPKKTGEVFVSTLKQLKFSIITVVAVIGLAYLCNYSGISYTLGLAFSKTGKLFPAFSPFLGWLGVFMTGSVTSSSALFGKLQQVTAQTLELNPVLTIAGNIIGGIMGKLISPQSIAIACAATGLVGRETDIFRAVLKYSVILLGIVILMILFQAYVMPGIVPVLPVTP